MRRRLPGLVSFIAVIMVTTLLLGSIWTSPSNALFTSKTLYFGTIGEINASNDFVLPNFEGARHKSKTWESKQTTKGFSDLYVQSNIWQAGGSTGWHTHLGHSLIIVTEGTVIDYEGNDPECKPHAYTQGMGFVDPGGGHVHLLRNEGDIVAKTVSVQLVPASAARRIDATDPGNCHFPQ